jgi:hypothetical protein
MIKTGAAVDPNEMVSAYMAPGGKYVHAPEAGDSVPIHRPLDPFHDCQACTTPEAIVGSPRIDEVAMDLARRGGRSDHEIRHTMMAYAKLASDRAIEWAKAYDERCRLEDAEAKWDTDHGTEYEDPES